MPRAVDNTGVRSQPDRALQRDVQPDGHAVGVDRGPILPVHERPSAGGDHQMAAGHIVQQRLPLHRSEVSLALPGKDVGDGLTLALLDDLVHVDRLPA
jgi:hypothetical protein